MATRSVVLCSSGDAAATASGGPLSLVVSSSGNCEDGDTALPIYRGTIVGNVVLLCAVSAVALICSLILRIRRPDRSLFSVKYPTFFPLRIEKKIWFVLMSWQVADLKAGVILS